MFQRKICFTFIQKRTLNKANLFPSRNVVNHIRHNINRDVVLLTIEKSKINSIQDWSSVRKAILEHERNRGQYTDHNIDAMIVGHCVKAKQYDLGASYITFLNQENVKLNLATIGKFLRLIYLRNYRDCLESGKTCNTTEENLIIKHYEEIRKDYPILDSFTLENIAVALSLTSRWKECLDILKEIKVSTVPSVPCYSAVIASSFLNKEEDLGWELLEEVLGYEKLPQGVVYLAYIKSIQSLKKKEDILKKLEKLFLFFQEKDLKCDEEVASSISGLAKKLGYQGKFTSVAYKGNCMHCSKTLDKFELSNEEFSELKTKIFEKAIVGRDIFMRTTPDEVERFKQFVGSMGQFDVVLDGLNVAYSGGTKQTTQVLSYLVASVVSHFVKQNKTVLVLGREHMKRWPHKNWSYITHHARVFLAQNISQDDPYLLYCALNSGKNTVIVTRDLMRSHKFLLKDGRLKMLFNRWLSQRQWQLVRVDDAKGPIFVIPPPYNIIAQCNRGTWHIPYETNAPKEKNEFHRTWLCLKK